MHDIISDSYQYARSRTMASTGGATSTGGQVGRPSNASRAEEADDGTGTGKGKKKAGVNVQGGVEKNRTVLTMEDLNNALEEYGIQAGRCVIRSFCFVLPSLLSFRIGPRITCRLLANMYISTNSAFCCIIHCIQERYHLTKFWYQFIEHRGALEPVYLLCRKLCKRLSHRCQIGVTPCRICSVDEPRRVFL